MKHRASRIGFVALVISCTVLVFAESALAACGGRWNRHATGQVERGDGSQFSGVAMRFRRNVWAVGLSAEINSNGEVCCIKSLTAHFNGNRWSRFASENPGVRFNVNEGTALVDVAMSRRRAWAVGYYDTGCFSCLVSQRTLIERFNGNRWVQVPSPNPGPATGVTGERFNALYDVEAINDNLAYAVGGYLTSFSQYLPLILRWNGNRWSQVSPAGIQYAGLRPTLSSITARGPNDLWAVGDYRDVDGTQHPYVLHSTNGANWNFVGAPSPATNSALTGVAPFGPNRARAVGYVQPTLGDATTFPMIQGGTPGGFGLINSPNPSVSGAAYSDVTTFRTRAGGHIYAVGAYSTGYPTTRLFVARSTPGQPGFRRMRLPKVSDVEQFNGVASSGNGDVFAVGQFYNSKLKLRTLVESCT